MEFVRSALLVPRLEVLAAAASTNDELVQRASGSDAADWGDLSTLVTDTQTAGRGRLGRSWITPPGAALAVSVLLRPAGGVPAARFGWFPLLAGLAATRAVASVLALQHGAPSEPQIALKWPNDVLIDGKKVCGILSELLPDARSVVIGAGFNLTQTQDQLPIEAATSLRLAAATANDPVVIDPDAVLAEYLSELALLYRDLLGASGDPLASGLHAGVTAACGTIGTRVRVELPAPNGQDVQLGTATGLDPLGRLLVEQDGHHNGSPLAVAAGDITHLRY